MVQLLQNLADEFADFAQGMVRGYPLLRMNVRKHPALILRPSAHLQSSRRIRGELNHHSFALARFFSKLLERPWRERGRFFTRALRSMLSVERLPAPRGRRPGAPVLLPTIAPPRCCANAEIPC